MQRQNKAWAARWALWTVRRNPLYLVSAALMAVGVRLYLVGPDDSPGDIRLILTTLVVVQVYEWAVTAVLLFLHRHRRSLEDQPSLLLVAALFWTGPMAATIEMIALDPRSGTGVAAGACVIALAEFHVVRRVLGLRFSLACRVAAAACVNLVALAPLLLVPGDTVERYNELLMYAVWWVLGGITLLGLWAARAQAKAIESMPEEEARSKLELVWMVLVVAAGVFHAVGMNHAFYCHTRPFYAAPVIAAASIVISELARRGARRDPGAVVVSAVMPAVALLLSVQPFHPDVPAAALPRIIADPMVAAAALAAACWWFAYSRHRHALLLHMANAAFVLALWRIVAAVTTPVAEGADAQMLAGSPRNMLAVLLFAVALYLAVSGLLRNCRAELLGALSANFAAVATLVGGRTDADGFVLWLLAGWSAWLALHIAVRAPGVLLRLAPVLLLVVIPWFYDSDTQLQWIARGHAVVLCGVLLTLGQVWPSYGYRRLAVLVMVLQAMFHGGRALTYGSRPAAALSVATAFVLLGCAALISWRKQRLQSTLGATITEPVKSDSSIDQIG